MPDLLGIEFETADCAVIAHVTGEVDMISASGFADRLGAAHDNGILGSSVVVDLTGVTFFGSSGVRALVLLDDRCSGEVAFRVVPTPMIAQVLSISGADQVLELAKTVDQALSDFRTASGEVSPPRPASPG
jgi:anti-anti-sigma factor